MCFVVVVHVSGVVKWRVDGCIEQLRFGLMLRCRVARPVRSQKPFRRRSALRWRFRICFQRGVYVAALFSCCRNSGSQGGEVPTPGNFPGAFGSFNVNLRGRDYWCAGDCTAIKRGLIDILGRVWVDGGHRGTSASVFVPGRSSDVLPKVNERTVKE